MRHYKSHQANPLLAHLRQKSPHWLRQQLTNPDPIYLHDWHKTPTQFQDTVTEALKLQGFDQ